jgi:hypothetical protein
MTGSARVYLASLLVLLTAGCATTYVPVSWGLGDKVQRLSRSDLTLATLFDRYDPERKTLRIAAVSFDQVMMPGEVRYHLGAYRQDARLIYRNLYHDYSDRELRDVVLHELTHHVWFNFMSPEQRTRWRVHLLAHPTPLQEQVRRNYDRPASYDSEDFAFTVEYARPVDIEELVRIGIVTAQEGKALLQERARRPLGAPHSVSFSADEALATRIKPKGPGPAQ